MSSDSATASIRTSIEKEERDVELDVPVKRVEGDNLNFQKRSWSSRIPFVSTQASPPRVSLDDAEPLPEATANIFDLVTFGWMTSILAVGYARPLEAPDLYKLGDHRQAAYIGNKITASFEQRCLDAEAYNKRLQGGEINPGFIKALWWLLQGNRAEREKKWREVDGKKKPSLLLAMNDSVKWWFWSAGLLKVIGDTAQVTSPLVVKQIITFAEESYTGHQTGGTIPPVGKGVGFTFLLLALQIIASLCTHHFFYRAASTGVLIRGGLITAIYSRTLRLTSKARGSLTNGLIMNHISTDVSRIDFCAGFFHMSWTAPIQLIICLILLILQLGPSALAGFAFLVVAVPIQGYVIKTMFALRRKSMQWTDKRAKMLQEILGGMQIIKFFAWEVPFLKKIFGFRHEEMGYIRSLLLIRSGNNALAMSMPVLASVLAFVTYSLTGHSLVADSIFTALTLFNLLRMPLMFLPLSLSTITDAMNATRRLTVVFEAQVFEETRDVEEEMDVAIEIKGASFSWDAPPPEVADPKKKKGSKSHAITEKELKEKLVDKAEEKAFEVLDVSMEVPRGQLVAIVGAVGSGKTSLLQGIIGEMRKTTGSVKFGGSIAYCPQSAWIQNATIRENICFGRPFEEQKYWTAVRDSCLEPDLDMLPNRDLTEVGEKGISLSGGQKQRLNICRAIYCDTDIQIFDDPLSALDAHVGKAVFDNVLHTSSSGKTRILVTHALHFLPHVDYIYTVLNGRIAERGTYSELINNDGVFSKFIKEFGSNEAHAEKKEVQEVDAIENTPHKATTTVTVGPALMQKEERNTGAIGAKVYKEYSRAAKGSILLPILALSLVSMQGATVMASYWLVYWEEDHWHQSPGFYMGIYASLGVSQAIATFLMGASFAMLTYFASQNLHAKALTRVMHAPMSFFETTPLGRIMNRFAKDIDTIDNILVESLRMFVGTASTIVGAIILIAIVVPWFLIAVVAILVVYYYAAVFYRASARELKRLDAMLRSSLYAHFSESLSGLATIRAYGEADRFRVDNERRTDVENRAYWLTVSNQRWLGIRLDFLGAILTFVVAILTVGTRFSISPAQTGLALSYILSVQQAFGWLVRQTAEVENDMNSVERVVHYATEVEQEAPYEIEDRHPPTSWPAQGKVELKNIVFKYRPELPPVLKGLSMSVGAGEKIGIVGRTGAGKSSIMTALYRIVELTSGTITIDDVDISKIGLMDLRSALAIIPQDPLLFSGTLRSNLDPFNLHDDATLWDALKRSYLVDHMPPNPALKDEEAPSGSQTPMNNRFSLDTVIEDEGANLSIGQRSLVSLARALVKDSRVIILDEATASVDYETDRNIQDTIANEFQDRTILCIAHRLRTIISYDRICVLDAGQISEFDAPAKLYENGGIFRGMCERSSITLDDIRYALKGRKGDVRVD